MTKKMLSMLPAALLIAGCASPKAAPQVPQAVQTQRVGAEPRESGGAQRYSAVVQPDLEIPLSFRIPGYVVGLKRVRGEGGQMRDIAEGDRVARGTVLVRIRADEYGDRVRQATSQAGAAEALAVKAQLDFERASRLYASQSLTKVDLDAARAQYDATRNQLQAARATTSEAQLALRDTAVTAPFDLEIVEKRVELGTFVAPGSPVLVLAKTDVVKIVVGVPDTAVRAITPGQTVDVAVDAFANRTFQAHVSRIASAADPKTRNFEVEIAVPNRDRALKVGMIASLQLASPEPETLPTARRVPLSAIVQASDGRHGVFVVTRSSAGAVARLRPVEIGDVVGTEIIVAGGLGDDDDVVTTGANLLKDGQLVEVVR